MEDKDNYVVCVKWGTLYSDDYVIRMKNMVERNTTVPHKFMCVSDTEIEGIECIPIRDKGLKTWWTKIEIFDLPIDKTNARVVYFDLDTVIVGNIDWMFEYDGNIMGIENLGVNNPLENSNQYYNQFQSGVLIFNPFYCRAIYQHFYSNKNKIYSLYRGDGEYMNNVISPMDRDLLQRKYPGKLKSYKYEVYNKGLDDDLAIVCFHGIPNPHEACSKPTNAWGTVYQPRDWILEYWR